MESWRYRIGYIAGYLIGYLVGLLESLGLRSKKPT